MSEFLFYFEKMQKLRKFHNVQPVIQDILSHMETALQAALDLGNKNLFSKLGTLLLGYSVLTSDSSTVYGLYHCC